MKVWLIHLWDTFRSGFWFVPTLMALAAVAAAVGVPLIDQAIELDETLRFRWLTTTPAAARATLSALVGAMITVVGVVFSITVVTLSLTTSQFGSRLLRTLMASRTTQFSLGVFLAVSVYCLLLLPRVYGAGDRQFVPHLGVALAVVAAVVNLVVLIYFIHHVAMSIQAQSVVKAVADDLDDAIRRMFPDELDESVATDDDDCERRLRELGPPALLVPSAHDGYVQGIDTHGLIELAQRHDLVFEIRARPGHFIVKGQPLARLWCRDEPSDVMPEDREDGVCQQVQEAWILGHRRTPRQDVECAIDELVEVAVRALSPGINDPFTAMACLDRLGGSLFRLAGRKIPSPLRYDGEDRLRVVEIPVTFSDVLEAAFNQIRQYGRSSVSVTIRMLEVLTLVGRRVRREGDRRALRRQAEMILNASSEFPEDGDRQDVRDRFEDVCGALKSSDTEAGGSHSDQPHLPGIGPIRAHRCDPASGPPSFNKVGST